MQTTASPRLLKLIVFALSCVPVGAPLLMLSCGRCDTPAVSTGHHPQTRTDASAPAPADMTDSTPAATVPPLPPDECKPCSQTPADLQAGDCLPTACGRYQGADGGAVFCCSVPQPQ